MELFSFLTCLLLHLCLLYVASGQEGYIHTVVGNGNYYAEDIGNGGIATAAVLRQPEAVTFDGQGNMYVADMYDHKIRKVDAQTGYINDYAGSSFGENVGDGAAATNARLARPYGIAIDSSDNIFVSEHLMHRVRKMTKSNAIDILSLQL